ncbi:MAG: DUF1772 domain-containing protein [Kutzneria sp.]|nr:DUF1772 domain-containing protein [Kutzneria sp.]
MSSRVTGFALGTATVCTGLLAGLYYAYVCSVMPALAHLDDHVFVTTMNQINIVIVNPVFMVSFAGAPLATFIAVLVLRRSPASAAIWWSVAGLALNGIGLVVTVVVNVPLNDALASTGDRAVFESDWVTWTVVRAVATTGAFACLVAARTSTSTSAVSS